jgi:primosomal protein N' (replication factor Y)
MPHADTRVQKVATRKALASAAGDAFSRKCSILRIPPATPRQNVVEAALSHLGDRDVLILVPEHHDAEVLSERLSRLGHRVARMPGEWGKAASGSCVVIGTRNAVFAPMPKTRAILVLDAHAEAYVSERAPTWNATVLAKERGHRAQAPCVFVSACPTLELLAMGDLVTISRADERSGWPAIEILDRRLDDPRSGLYAENLASILRKAVHDDPHRSALCVLNRTGRARLMACGVCGELVCCEVCGAALAQVARANLKTENELVCPSCATRRASFCAKCASLRLKTLRVGVTRAREELAALTGLDVGEITASSARRADDTALRAPVLVGTEAVLHRVSSASLVVFLDFDQELCAPRFRAGEDALALLARAARLVGVRRSGPKASDEKGRIVVQTRLPDHEVLQAARSGDPEVLSAQEALRRASLKLPPAYALALLSGEGAEHLAKEASAQGECEAIGLSEQRFVLRAKHQASIADALAKAAAPPEKVRIEIDPMRL